MFRPLNVQRNVEGSGEYAKEYSGDGKPYKTATATVPTDE